MLVNGLRVKWLEFFEGDKISFEAALMGVAIDRGSRTPIEKQVAKQLQYAAQAARRNAGKGGAKSRAKRSGMNADLSGYDDG